MGIRHPGSDRISNSYWEPQYVPLKDVDVSLLEIGMEETRAISSGRSATLSWVGTWWWASSSS